MITHIPFNDSKWSLQVLLDVFATVVTLPCGGTVHSLSLLRKTHVGADVPWFRVCSSAGEPEQSSPFQIQNLHFVDVEAEV